MAVIATPALIAAYKVQKRNEIHAEARNRYEHAPVLWIQERAQGYMYSKLIEVAETIERERRTAVQSCHDAGKALDLNTLLPTPDGWVTMEDTQVGQKLYDENGLVCSVIAVSEIEERECYEIEFNNGSKIVAADNHLWDVIDFYSRPRNVVDWRTQWNKTKVIDTKTIFENIHTNLGQQRWKIPTCKSLVGTTNWNYRWEPYTFGAWLGDGTTVRWEITTHNNDAEEMAAWTGGTIIPQKNKNVCVIRLPGRNTVDCPTRILNKPTKYIPSDMFRVSYDDRLALLQGLMDTDGSICHRGLSVEIAVTNQELAEGIQELAASLGWVTYKSNRDAKLYDKVCGTSYRVTFTPTVNPFRLSRKALLWDAIGVFVKDNSRKTQHGIKNVVGIGKRLVKCVEVDSPRKLYLVGKSLIPTHNSWLFARLACWWIDSSSPGEAFVLTTAPTAKQVRAVLWKEMRRAYNVAKLAGRMNQTEWWLNGEMVAMGRKPSDYDPTAFQGIHARKVLVLLDEGCGIVQEIFIAANSLIANEWSKIAVIGNPDDPDSHFAKVCATGSGWHTVKISAFDTPNFTSEEAPQAVKDVLISKLYVEEMAADVGEDSAVYTSKVLGEFPQNKIDGVVPFAWILACQDEEEYERSFVDALPIELGVDLGAGGDNTSIRARHGKFIGGALAQKTPDPEEAFYLVVHAIMDVHATRCKVDSIGIGWGLIGMLQQAVARGRYQDETTGTWIDISYCEIVGIDVRKSATDPERYPRLRDQMWMEIGRELTRSKGWNLYGLDDLTIDQLTRPIWKPDIAGRARVETKDEMMKRTSRPSPDEADALLMAFIEPPTGDIEEISIYHDPVYTGPEY